MKNKKKIYIIKKYLAKPKSTSPFALLVHKNTKMMFISEKPVL